MSFFRSLTQEKSKKIFLISFFISSLFPVLIVIVAGYYYLLPILDADDIDKLREVFAYGVMVLLFFPLLTFFLMFRWFSFLERVTAEITMKTMEVSAGKKEFAGQNLQVDDIYLSDIQSKYPRGNEENEIQSIVRSFNEIFHTAADQIEERNRIKEILAGLIAMASDLTSELDFDRLFPLIIGKVTDAMAAERTSLYVVDWEKREIWTRVAQGIGQIRLPLGEGISGRVAESGEMINVVDAWELPYFNRTYDETNNFRTRSVLCIPIRGRRVRHIGVLQVINKRRKHLFDHDDEILIKGLVSQVGIALENSLLVDELKLSFERSISSLSAIVDAKHPFTAGHSERVTEYSLLMAGELGLSQDQCEMLRYASLLHDIGKIGIRDEILTKNGAFTPDEFKEMQLHPVKTKVILEKFHFPEHLRRVPEIASCHHERINGKGYPAGLQGDEIPLESKIMAVADVFDALTSKRDYPKYAFGEILKDDRMPINKVIAILQGDSGSHFDPVVVDTFQRCLKKALLRYRGEHFPPEYVDEFLQHC
ncbi:MAG: HD domain-containing protein [Deltaproteobacteria bacterium]|nr:HD domain-containing protein [Deltaproteobacteria bacterium]